MCDFQRTNWVENIYTYLNLAMENCRFNKYLLHNNPWNVIIYLTQYHKYRYLKKWFKLLSLVSIFGEKWLKAHNFVIILFKLPSNCIICSIRSSTLLDKLEHTSTGWHQSIQNKLSPCVYVFPYKIQSCQTPMHYFNGGYICCISSIKHVCHARTGQYSTWSYFSNNSEICMLCLNLVRINPILQVGNAILEQTSIFLEIPEKHLIC